MDFDFPSTDAATLPRDSNDVLLIQQNHAEWQPIIGFVTNEADYPPSSISRTQDYWMVPSNLQSDNRIPAFGDVLFNN
jgi:hypothetical protein